MTATDHGIAHLLFRGDLPGLFRPAWRDRAEIIYPVTRSASIKDVIESFGLPHTEIGQIECNGRLVDFAHAIAGDQWIVVSPVPHPFDVTRPSILRPDPLPLIRFLVDINVGKLARYLRMAGVDTLYDPVADDNKIVRMAVQKPMVVLTRDQGLLRRREIVFARCVRSVSPVAQFHEIVRLFGLTSQLEPFSRCLECNALLEPVSRAEVMPRLEPLTKKYYRTFSRCRSCDKVYWSGSHVEMMRRMLGLPSKA